MALSPAANGISFAEARRAEMERRILDRESAETLQLLETLISAAPFGFAFVDREFRFVHVNENLAAINGLTVAEHLGHTVAEIVPPLWPQLESLYRQVLEGDQTVVGIEVDAPNAANPAEMRHWLTSFYPVSLNEEVIGIGVVVIDVTDRRRARHALEASQRQLADAQRIAHVGSFELDLVTHEMTWSKELYRLTETNEELQPSGKLIVSMVHPDDLPGLVETWKNATTDGVPFDAAYRLVLPHSGTRCVRVRVVAETAVDGTVVKLLGTLMDETERIDIDRVRREAETRFEVGFEQTAIGTAIVDLKGFPVRVNQALCDLLARPEQQLVGRRWRAYSHPDDAPLREAVLQRVSSGHDTYEDERRYFRPDGSVVWGSCHVTLVRDRHGRGEYYFLQIQDITARKKLEHELAHQAVHDSLTGLPNRTLLTDRLVHGLAGSRRRGAQLGVIFLDIDHLKDVNDSLGHAAGDKLLRHTARRVASAIRPGDTVARLGGDEFVVVCDDVSALETEEIAGRVMDALSEPYLDGDQEMKVTASVGIAIADVHATPESLLRDSDAAMYRAKERGRGRIELFDEALRLKAERRVATSSALHRALERGEFVVRYQPIVDLCTGAMVSAEALLRWQHPARGLLSPHEFIPLAEETGLIVPIGAWVIEQACSRLVEWQRVAPAMSVAVNVSVRQLAVPDIADRIHDILRATGLQPSTLCLELTESVSMENVDYSGTLAALKALGVRLAIDDFGTGYSSLSYLKRFSLDAVKVDRTFVDGLGTDPHDTALVTAIVAMADALRLEVTAEGVETRDQLLNLEQLGCPRAQGFYLARPMPTEQLTELLVASHHWPLS